jgi:RNA polymerase sigma-70 factor (ECF subfamily)
MTSTVPKDERNDEDLMAAYKAGEVAAYRILVERHHAPVYRFCLRALRSPEAAADATQEVFLRVVKNAPSWERKAKFTTWLYTMARNWCIDEARKARFRRTESLNEPAVKGGEGESGEERLDRVATELPQPDRVADNVKLRAVLDAAIADLPDEQREVFLLREQGGLQFKDIAELQKRLQAAGFVAPSAETPDARIPAAEGVVSGETPQGPPGGARGPP